jgi:hypothetical protein
VTLPRWGPASSRSTRYQAAVSHREGDRRYACLPRAPAGSEFSELDASKGTNSVDRIGAPRLSTPTNALDAIRVRISRVLGQRLLHRVPSGGVVHEWQPDRHYSHKAEHDKTDDDLDQRH